MRVGGRRRAAGAGDAGAGRQRVAPSCSGRHSPAGGRSVWRPSGVCARDPLRRPQTGAGAAGCAGPHGAPPAGEGDLGPVSILRQYRFAVGLLKGCRENGCRFSTGGVPTANSAGWFLAQTLVDDPPENSRVVAENQFGPVLPLLRLRDEDDVVAQTTVGPYALRASVWSADADAAARLARPTGGRECGSMR
ncbi:aldehyde dehydrogenase family protein [Streptomyces sp. NPDC048409]|uniref:aldehyde dehydrogenase family protein n=1 Tax=Streptomyces sp. NPDC048409 TaxID=3154723 RepID=UPI00342F14D6